MSRNFLPLSDPSATFSNSKKGCIELDVLVIYPILRNAQKARTNMALNNFCKKADLVVNCKALVISLRIEGVMGSLESAEGLAFWNSCNIFLQFECLVISSLRNAENKNSKTANKATQQDYCIISKTGIEKCRLY